MSFRAQIGLKSTILRQWEFFTNIGLRRFSPNKDLTVRKSPKKSFEYISRIKRTSFLARG